MKIRAEQLAQSMQSLKHPIVIISGDEILLVQEAINTLRQAAQQAGYTERLRFDANADFDWKQLPAFCQSLSLFAERRLIEVHNPSEKLSKDAQQQLQLYAKHPNPDCLLLLVLPKLTKAQQHAKWFTALEKVSVFVQIWPLSAAQFPHWLKQCAQHHGLQLTADALQLFVYLTAGNLLAAQQACEKLALMNLQKTIDAATIRAAIHDQGYFDIFQLSDAVLQGDAPLVMRCWQHAKNSGQEPQLVLWALSRDLRDLRHLLQREKLTGIWPQRQQLLHTAMRRFSVKHVAKLLQSAGMIDRMLKGALPGNHWDALLNLALRMAGIRQLPRCFI